MNLHRIVSGAIGMVNPFVDASIKRSNGFTVDVDGTQIPAYHPTLRRKIQRQELTQGDLVKLDGLNIQGERAAIYVDGAFWGVLRDDQKGGDLICFKGQDWLVVAVLESWPDWCKVAACRQL